MNNKGFTLIELLATIVLMAIMITTVALNMSGIRGNQDESNYKIAIRTIEESACSFIEQLNFSSLMGNGETRDSCKSNSSGCYIGLDKLISEGLVDENATLFSEFETMADYKDKVRVLIKWNSDGSYKVKSCTCELKNDDGSYKSCTELVN